VKYLSVCSGIEAASKAWEPIGWQPAAFSEIEPFPAAVLKHHWPEVPNLGDMTKYEQWPIQSGTIDLLVGGTPCQSFSVAGLRQGLKDPRGNLMLTYLAIAERLKPRWLVWENVPGVLSSNGGKDFGSFLGALGELGYEWAYRVLDAQWFGVAQRRRRVFVVAHLGKGNLAAKVLFESESVRRNPAPSREAGQGVAADAQTGVGSGKWPAELASTLNAAFGSKQGLEDQHALGGAPLFVLGEKKSHWDGSEVHPTLNQAYGKSGAIGYSNQELFSQGGSGLVQAIPIHDQATRNAGKRGDKQDGKGNGLGVGKPGDPAPTLTKGDKHAIAYHKTETPVAPTIGASGPPYSRTGNQRVEADALAVTFTQQSDTIYESNRRDGLRIYEGTSPTLQSFMGTGGGNVPLVQEAIAYDMKQHHNPQPTENIQLTTKNCSFVRGDSPLVQEPVAVDCYNKTIADKSQSISSSASDINHTGGVINPADRMAVRRLTPRECERLQGFPDDHTLISWRGKPADQCPDGPRYKALGNSMAVPCMAWIGKRIERIENERQGAV